MLNAILLSTILALGPVDSLPEATSLELTITDFDRTGGRVWVGIYTSPADFLDREKARLVMAEVRDTGPLTITIDSLVPGREYALALFHDEDDNGELNLNWLGLPSEPWAFSGRPKTRLRLPRFGEVKFCFNPRTRRQVLRLRDW